MLRRMTAQAIRHAHDVMELRAGEARRIYARLQDVRATARAVDKEEGRVFALGGWDGPPTLFFLREHIHTRRVQRASFPVLTEMLREQSGASTPAETLIRLAHVTEVMRDRVDGKNDPTWPEILNVGGSVPWRTGREGDLLDAGPRHRFHGVGFTSAGWMGPPDGERVEAHNAYYAGRDGWAIEVWRIHGNAEVPGARYSIPSTPDGSGALGTVPQAMTRLCNAIAANPVPVRPDAQP